jgi:hypothetical protein
VFTTSATQKAGQAEVEILTVATADVAIPDSCTTEVACGNRRVWYPDEQNRRGQLIFNQFILDHLAE